MRVDDNALGFHLYRDQYTTDFRVQFPHWWIVALRVLGAGLRPRNYWSQSREIILKALTLNVMILPRQKVFDRAGLTPFLEPR